MQLVCVLCIDLFVGLEARGVVEGFHPAGSTLDIRHMGKVVYPQFSSSSNRTCNLSASCDDMPSALLGPSTQTLG